MRNKQLPKSRRADFSIEGRESWQENKNGYKRQAENKQQSLKTYRKA